MTQLTNFLTLHFEIPSRSRVKQLSILLLSLGLSHSSSAVAKSKTIGWLENITLSPPAVQITAKIDSGANTASLDARDIEILHTRHGKYVKFTFIEQQSKQPHMIQLPWQGEVEIKRRFAESENNYLTPEIRPVVLMNLCFQSTCKEIEVNLTNRAHFDHQLLVGRKALHQFGYRINPSKIFLLGHS